MPRMNKLDIQKNYEFGLKALKINDLQKAQSYFQIVLDLDESHIGANQAMGLLAVSQENYEVALSWLNRVKKLAPEDAMNDYKMGNCQKRLNQLELAENMNIKDGD